MIPQSNNPLGFLEAILKNETIVLPSGNTCVIQEMDGDTEDKTITVKNIQEGKMYDTLIKAIILSFDSMPMSDDILKALRSKDKAYIALKYRIMVHGPEMAFKHTFQGKDEQSMDLEEDLTIFDQDFSKPIEPEFIPKNPEAPEEGVIKNPKFSPLRCTPYPDFESNDIWFYFSLSSKRTLRCQYLTTLGESSLLDKSDQDIKMSDKLLARFIQIKDTNGEWHMIPNFKRFSSTDMSEIRTYVEKFDDDFQLWSTVIHPKTGKKEEVSLFSKLEDFFFPRGI